jgi:DNA-binding CsgD family transcriptional regulator
MAVRTVGLQPRDRSTGRFRRGPQQVPPPTDLSRRQVQILAMVAGGYSYQQIGLRLYLARETVGTHLARIRRKLGAATTMEAVETARRRGLLPARSSGRWAA